MKGGDVLIVRGHQRVLCYEEFNIVRTLNVGPLYDRVVDHDLYHTARDRHRRSGGGRRDVAHEIEGDLRFNHRIPGLVSSWLVEVDPHVRAVFETFDHTLS